MPTVRQKLNNAIADGIPIADLKRRMAELGLRKEDLDLEYDAARNLGQTRLTVVEGLPFLSQDDLQQPQTPSPTPTPAQPQRTPPTPLPAPATPDVEGYRGPTLKEGKPIEGEGFVKAGMRYLLPEPFESAILGPEPVTYDRAKTQADIARFRTINPDEYVMDARQIARVPGFIAGAATEAAKLPLELAAQVPEAALRAAQLVTPVADIPESQARQLGAEEYRKGIAKGITRIVEPIVPGTRVTAEQITPKATQQVMRRFSGEDPDEELRLQAKDLYSVIQEDVEEALGGTIQSIFTDIIPLLPSKEPKDIKGYFVEGFERGEQLPGALGAFGAIGYKAANKFANGDISGGLRALYERPGTLLLTLAPVMGKLPPAARAKLAKIYLSPALLPWSTAKLGAKGVAKFRNYLKGDKPGTAETRAAQAFDDPLIQETPEQTARAERIYEEARATREKARTATEKLADAAEQAEREVLAKEKTVVTETGTEPVTNELAQKVAKETDQLYRDIVKKEKGQDYLDRLDDIDLQIEQGEALIKKVERGEATPGEIQVADLYDTSHRQRLLKERELLGEYVLEARERAKAEINRKYGPVREQPTRPKISPEAAEFQQRGVRPVTVTPEGRFIYEQPTPREITVSEGLLNKYGKQIDRAEFAKVETFVDQLPIDELKSIEERRTWVDNNIPAELRKHRDIIETIIQEPDMFRPESFGDQPIIARQVGPELYAETREAFKPSYPQERPGTRYQLTKPLKQLIAEGAADIVEGNTGVFLRDAAITKDFANYLVEKYSRGLDKKAKAEIVNRLSREIQVKDPKGSISPIEITGLESNTFLDPAQIKTELAEFLNVSDKGSVEQLRQEIRDRVLFNVRNQAFRQSLADNIGYETAGAKRNNFNEIIGPMDTAAEVAKDIELRKVETGGLPLSIKVPETGMQTFDAVIQQVARTSELDAQTLNNYVRPSPELARIIGSDSYVSPTFNSSFTSIIKAFDTIGKVELGFNYIVAESKRGFTSRNISAAKNNILANVLLYTVSYGPLEGVMNTLMLPRQLVRQVARDVTGKTGEVTPTDLNPFSSEANQAFTRFVNKKPINNFERILFDAYRESGLIDNTNISNEVSLLNKGNMLTEFVLDPAAKKGVPGARLLSRAIKKINTAQDAVYTFGDNYFKFLAAEAEFNFGVRGLEALEVSTPANPTTVTFRLGRELKIRVMKSGPEQFRVVTNRRNAQGNFTTRAITTNELGRVMAKASSRMALEKFVDYERIPGYLAWLRSTAPGGIASLFATWAYKMMDAPGKGGIVSHLFANETIFAETNSPKIAALNEQVKVQRGANKAQMSALARTQMEEDQDGDVRRMLAFNPNGLNLISVSTSNVDPTTLIYRDATATNFMGQSEAMARLLLATGAAATSVVAPYLEKTLENAGFPVALTTSPEYLKIVKPNEKVYLKDVSKLYHRWKAGKLISAKEVLSIANFAGNPIFDFFDMAVESDKNPYVDLGNFAIKTFENIAIGSTGKYLMDAAFSQGAGRKYIKEGGDVFTRVLFNNVYKREQNYSYRSEVLENQKIFAREAINLALGTSYRYAFVHKDLNGIDKGKFARFVDQHKKNLDASLLRSVKLRTEALAQEGRPDDDPAFKEILRRYEMLKIANEAEHAAFKMRVFRAIDKTGFYENLDR